MKYLILGILIFLVGCASQEKLFMEAPKDLRVGAMVMIESPKYEELIKALMFADDAIDSLNSYISELEWELYKSKHPTEARVTELESDGWQVHTVRPGDCLSCLAMYYYGYGDVNYYTMYLWQINSNIIDNINFLYPGQVLKIKRREY